MQYWNKPKEKTPEQPTLTLTHSAGITVFIQNGQTICAFNKSTQNGKTVDALDGIEIAKYEVMPTSDPSDPLLETIVVHLKPYETSGGKIVKDQKRFFLINWGADNPADGIKEYTWTSAPTSPKPYLYNPSPLISPDIFQNTQGVTWVKYVILTITAAAMTALIANKSCDKQSGDPSQKSSAPTEIQEAPDPNN